VSPRPLTSLVLPMLAVLGVGLALASGPAWAHEVRPAYLELRERQPGELEVLWKAPARGDQRLDIAPRLPASCRDGAHRSMLRDGAWIERWESRCEGGLGGGRIGVEGLDATRTDVLVRIVRHDGSTTTDRLTPDAPAFTVTGPAGRVEVLATYVALGVEHILLGVDHLLFVLTLLFLVQGTRRLVATVTAFTVAHSLTLSAAALGWVRVPSAPVEAAIALSIVFVAAEVARGETADGPDLARRMPWLVAFAFGLLHGFGFAGALHEVGLPERAIPLALLGFNLGVELGQLAFVAAALLFFTLTARILPPTPFAAHDGNAPSEPEATTVVRVAPWSVARRLARPGCYLIGPLAAFWLIQRTAGF